MYATLVHSAHTTFETYIRPGDTELLEHSYAEIRRASPLFGFPPDDLPPTWRGFQHWMEQTIASDEIEVTDLAREIAKYLLAGPAGLSRLSPIVRVLCAGMLPDKLRSQFDLRWDRKTRVLYKAMTKTARLTAKRVPRTLRIVPVARTAEKRCQKEPSSRWRQTNQGAARFL